MATAAACKVAAAATEEVWRSAGWKDFAVGEEESGNWGGGGEWALLMDAGYFVGAADGAMSLAEQHFHEDVAPDGNIGAPILVEVGHR
jgi:hypothetical protein